MRKHRQHNSFQWLSSITGVVSGATRLDHCNAVLAGIPLHLARRLQSVMNAAARLVFASSKCDHITPLPRCLHWLKVPWRIVFKLAVLVYKCLHGLAPSYLVDELHSITVVCPRLLTVGDSVLLFFFVFCTVPLQCLWRDSVILISTLLLTYLLHHQAESEFRRRLRSASSHELSVSRTRRPSYSSRRCTDLEQSSAAYHICSVTSRLLLSLEDIRLRTLLPVITAVVPGKWHSHLWTR